MKKQEKNGVHVKRFFVPSQHAAGWIQIFPLVILWIKWFFSGIRERFDVIHCHDFDTLPVGYILATLRRKKLVFDSHEIYSGMMEDHLPKIGVSFVRFLEKHLVKKADAVIVPSEFFKKFYKISESKFVIVGNWKDPEDYIFPEEEKEKCKKRLEISDKSLVISYVANLGPERTLKPLLEAVKEIGENAVLIVAGKGEQEELVKSYNSNNIKYLGFMSDQKEIALITSISDVIYYGIDLKSFASKLNSPNKMFEAIASGKVFLSVDSGQMGLFINKYGIGLAMKEQTKEEIKQILNYLNDNPEIRESIKRNNAELALKEYNWNRAKKNLLTMYDNL